MTATGAPLRVSSISSPLATRFRTSEKLLAASVAVMRGTIGRYQINQTSLRAGRSGMSQLAPSHSAVVAGEK